LFGITVISPHIIRQVILVIFQTSGKIGRHKETFIKKQQEIEHYIQSVIKKAKNGEITKELLEKARKENFGKNAFNWGIGFAISAAFLSTFIPKIQYWITRKATGSNAFPGTADYSNEKK